VERLQLSLTVRSILVFKKLSTFTVIYRKRLISHCTVKKLEKSFKKKCTGKNLHNFNVQKNIHQETKKTYGNGNKSPVLTSKVD